MKYEIACTCGAVWRANTAGQGYYLALVQAGHDARMGY